jgi:hypothetical protein
MLSLYDGGAAPASSDEEVGTGCLESRAVEKMRLNERSVSGVA